MNGSRKCYIKIYLSEEIAVVKSNKSKEYIVSYYLYFNHGPKFHGS